MKEKNVIQHFNKARYLQHNGTYHCNAKQDDILAMRPNIYDHNATTETSQDPFTASDKEDHIIVSVPNRPTSLY